MPIEISLIHLCECDFPILIQVETVKYEYQGTCLIIHFPSSRDGDRLKFTIMFSKDY